MKNGEGSIPAISEMAPGEENAACDLVCRVFDEFVGTTFNEQGVSTFKAHAEPKAMASRREKDHFALVARDEGALVGVIEVRACAHVCLLFVESSHHRRGIGRALFKAALERCAAMGRSPAVLTVNSSEGAVPVYEALGFERTGETLTLHGVVHVPMAAVLSR
jgi:GNAT superfamily N-acetyltransferase